MVVGGFFTSFSCVFENLKFEEEYEVRRYLDKLIVYLPSLHTVSTEVFSVPIVSFSSSDRCLFTW